MRALLILFSFVLFSCFTFAQDITQSVAVYKQNKAEIFKIEENINQYKSQIAQINDNIKSLSENKSNIQKEISKLQKMSDIKRRQIFAMRNNIKSNINNTKYGLNQNLQKLKGDANQYNQAKSQIAQLSMVEKSITEIDKTDKKLRTLNHVLESASLRSQHVKQNAANMSAKEDMKLNTIKSQLMNLKTSLGVN